MDLLNREIVGLRGFQQPETYCASETSTFRAEVHQVCNADAAKKQSLIIRDYSFTLFFSCPWLCLPTTIHTFYP